jgi:hypothetical protein
LRFTASRSRLAHTLAPLLCAEHGRKPNLTETSETHPYVYAKFARYVALRELVRRSSLAIGESPVSWD